MTRASLGKALNRPWRQASLLAATTAAAAALACTTARSLTSASASAARNSALLSPSSTTFHQLAPDTFTVLLETTQGPIQIAVRRSLAPIGADRFYSLVRNGFYDDQHFFRVRANFIAQFGLNGNPAVIAAWKHSTIPDDPVRTTNSAGTVAYAMTGPNTRTTQIYINLADNGRLDSQGFAPFGQIISGMDAARRLYSGYGELAGGGMRGGKQGPIEKGGNAYLTKNFPHLDWIRRAVILQP